MPLRVAIIGAGITGLTAAYELAQLGHKVSVFDRAPVPGGQVATFTIGGGRLECYYHHLFRSDRYMLQLLQELGLGDRLRWINSKVGFFYGGKIYDFVTPLDLLRFSPLSLFDRVRLGLITLYLQRLRDWKRLEGFTAAQWLQRYGSPRLFEVVWGPLLRGKFGAAAPEIGMVWFWGKIYVRIGSRGKGMQRERLGYLEGSFGVVVDALVARLTALGATIHLRQSVDRILTKEGTVEGIKATDGAGTEATYPAEVVIFTGLSPLLPRLAPELPQDYQRQLLAARYKTAVCMVLALKRLLTPIYWLNISDPTIPFVVAVEHTNLVPAAHYGGKAVLYLSNYLSEENELLHLSQEGLLATYAPHLRRLNPQFAQEWIEEVHLFKDPAGQPIITPHYSQLIPSLRTPIPGLFVANTTQIYPEDRGTNYAVRLGKQVTQAVLEALEGLGQQGGVPLGVATVERGG